MLDIEASWRLLDEACPGFGASPEAIELDGEDGHYVWVAALARYLVRHLEDGQTSDLASACVVLETILRDGDENARTFANNGFVEDLTNGKLFVGRVRPGELVPFFGPLARANEWIMNIEYGFNS